MMHWASVSEIIIITNTAIQILFGSINSAISAIYTTRTHYIISRLTNRICNPSVFPIERMCYSKNNRVDQLLSISCSGMPTPIRCNISCRVRPGVGRWIGITRRQWPNGRFLLLFLRSKLSDITTDIYIVDLHRHIGNIVSVSNKIYLNDCPHPEYYEMLFRRHTDAEMRVAFIHVEKVNCNALWSADQAVIGTGRIVIINLHTLHAMTNTVEEAQ